MSKNKRDMSIVNYVIALIICIFIFLFIGLFLTGSTTYKIKNVTKEFQNLYLIKDNADLMKKIDKNFSVNTIHKFQNNLSLLVDDPDGNKSTTIKKLIPNGYSNLFFTSEKKDIELNSVNYNYEFCDNLEFLINKDPRETILGKIAVINFSSQDKKEYNEVLNNFYDNLKNRTIKINNIKVENKNKSYECNKEGNNKIEII